MPLWCIFIYTHMDNYNIENNNEQHECCMHGPGPDLHCSCVTTGNCSGADYKMFEWDYKCPTCTFHPDPFKRLQCFIRALATKGLASEKKIEEIEKILNGDDNVEGLIDKVESMLTDATIIDDHLDDDSANPVQNNVIKEAIDELRASLRQKQDTLTSGINIKTINGYPILGSGDISVGGETTWDSVTNKPTFATVATTGSYVDLVGKPNLAPVAFSGSYNDLLNKPDAGSNITVDSSLSTESEDPVQNKVITRNLNLTNQAINDLQQSKQQKLTSDTVLGTINGQSLTYGGSVSIAAGGGADVKSLKFNDNNTASLSGTGTYTVSGEFGIKTSHPAPNIIEIALDSTKMKTINGQTLWKTNISPDDFLLQERLTSSSLLGTINGVDLYYGDSITIAGGGSSTAGVTYLRQLSDVNTSGVSNGKILRYNSSSQKWIVSDDNGITSVKVGDNTYTPNSSGLVNIPALSSAVAINTATTDAANVVDLKLYQNDAVVSTIKVQGTQGITANRTGGGADVLVLGTNFKTVGGQSLINTSTPTADIPIPSVYDSTITFAVDDGDNRTLGGTVTLNQSTNKTIWLPSGESGGGTTYIQNPYVLQPASSGALGGIKLGYNNTGLPHHAPIYLDGSNRAYAAVPSINAIVQNSEQLIESGAVWELKQNVITNTSDISTIHDLLYPRTITDVLDQYTSVEDFEYNQSGYAVDDEVEITGIGHEGVYKVVYVDPTNQSLGLTLRFLRPSRELKFDTVDQNLSDLGDSLSETSAYALAAVNSIFVSTNSTNRAIRYTYNYMEAGDTPEVVIPIDSTPTENSTNLITSGGVYEDTKLKSLHVYNGPDPNNPSTTLSTTLDLKGTGTIGISGEFGIKTTCEHNNASEPYIIQIQPDMTKWKTINNNSLLKYAGQDDNLSLQPTLVSGTNIKTINGTSLLGSGDIAYDSSLSTSSENALQNKVIATELQLINGTVSNLGSTITSHTTAIGVHDAALYTNDYKEYNAYTYPSLSAYESDHSSVQPGDTVWIEGEGSYTVLSDYTLTEKNKLKTELIDERIDNLDDDIDDVLEIVGNKVNSVQSVSTSGGAKITYTTKKDVLADDVEYQFYGFLNTSTLTNGGTLSSSEPITLYWSDNLGQFVYQSMMQPTKYFTQVSDTDAQALLTTINGLVQNNTPFFIKKPGSDPSNPTIYEFVGTTYAIDGAVDHDVITIDGSPTNGSSNLVMSGGVHYALGNKQDKLLSGTNIKTVNGQSLLGSGNIAITATNEGLHQLTVTPTGFQTYTYNGHTIKYFTIDVTIDPHTPNICEYPVTFTVSIFTPGSRYSAGLCKGAFYAGAISTGNAATSSDPWYGYKYINSSMVDDIACPQHFITAGNTVNCDSPAQGYGPIPTKVRIPIGFSLELTDYSIIKVQLENLNCHSQRLHITKGTYSATSELTSIVTALFGQN